MAHNSRHSLPTRLLHAALAAAIVLQLFSSLGMMPAEYGHPENALFEMHEIGGLASLGLVSGFWLYSMLRQTGTASGALFPWLSHARLRALADDVKPHLSHAFRRSLPEHGNGSPLASAIHGFGLSLITVMAATGTIYLLSGFDSPEDAGMIMTIHKAFSSLVWIYLVGHAAMAFTTHIATGFDLRDMWSLTKRKAEKNIMGD